MSVSQAMRSNVITQAIYVHYFFEKDFNGMINPFMTPAQYVSFSGARNYGRRG